jgi:hypothetical protein
MILIPTPDVMGSVAFSPVKNDMLGNIKVRPRPPQCSTCRPGPGPQRFYITQLPVPCLYAMQ